MNEDLKSKFPSWCFEDTPLAVTLTDDIDSMVGCAIEKMVKGNEINYFYTFDSVYKMDHNVQLPTLGIDLAFTGNTRCFDNHVTRLHKDSKVNPNSANINSILNISGNNYYQKYCGSTALVMWSFYGLELPESKLGKMLLLSIDSSFKGHYDNRYREVHNKYLRLMGFDELIDLLNETEIQEYWDLIREYKLSSKHGGKIIINDDGYLQTQLPLEILSKELRIKLELPKQQFTLHKQYKNNGRQVNGDEIGELHRSIISFALTGKRYYKFTQAI